MASLNLADLASRTRPMADKPKKKGWAKTKHGHITAAGRKSLPPSDFALPGKGEGPEGKGSGSYPIDTPGRARAALSRGEANATPAEEKTIERKVHAKYPNMELKGEKKKKRKSPLYDHPRSHAHG
jgi:hypothetical protein